MKLFGLVLLFFFALELQGHQEENKANHFILSQ